jgi:hypothetical protein
MWNEKRAIDLETQIAAEYASLLDHIPCPDNDLGGMVAKPGAQATDLDGAYGDLAPPRGPLWITGGRPATWAVVRGRPGRPACWSRPRRPGRRSPLSDGPPALQGSHTEGRKGTR